MRVLVEYVFCGGPPPESEGRLCVTSRSAGVLAVRLQKAPAVGPGVIPRRPVHTEPTVKNVPVGVATSDWPAKTACVLAFEAAISSGATTRRRTVAVLRTRVHSVLLKKNNLFFLIGPPME